MTLGQLLPTFHKALHSRLEPGVWPAGTRVTAGGDMLVGAVPLTAVAARYGTPAGVLDGDEVRRRCAAYRAALPWAAAALTAAALPSPALLGRLAAEGLSVTVGSPAELAAARAAGFPASRTVAYGVPPGFSGTVVLRDGEHLAEDLARLRSAPGARVLLRVALGPADPGLPPAALPAALRRVLAATSAPAVGLHCAPACADHRISTYESAARRLLATAADLHTGHGLTPHRLHLSVGAAPRLPPAAPPHDARDDPGPAAARTEAPGPGPGPGHPPPWSGTASASDAAGPGGPDPAGMGERLRAAWDYECRTRGLPAPRLTVEWGGALTARAGIAVVRVVRADGGTVLVDGPVGGGPVARLVGRVPAARRRTVAVAAPGGPARLLALPEDVRAGDLIAVAGVHGPAFPVLVAVADGRARLLTGRPPDASASDGP